MSLETPEAQLAMDPATSPETLYNLAITHPELRELIAGNPSTYPALLEWLAGLGDPAVNAALALRGASTAQPSAGAPGVEVEEVAVEEATVVLPESAVAGQVEDATEIGAGVDDTYVEVEETVAQSNGEYVWTEAELLAAGQADQSESETTQFAPSPVEATAYYAPASSAQPPQQPAPTTSAPPPLPPAQTSSGKQGGQGGKIFVYVLLAILTAAVVGVIVYLLLNMSSGGEERETVVIEEQDTPEPEPEVEPEPEPEPDPEPEPEPEPDPEPEPEEDEEDADIEFPLPNPDATSNSFYSPSGNIACKMGKDETVCTIYSNDYEAAGYPSCPGGITSISVSFKEATLACDATPVDPDSTMGPLLYDTTTLSGNYACGSRESGINCWNIKSGKSIAMARGAWTTGNRGPIDPTGQTW